METAQSEQINVEFEDLVNFDAKGNVVVKKHCDASSKLVARRAIEAHNERKRMENLMEDSYWDDM